MAIICLTVNNYLEEPQNHFAFNKKIIIKNYTLSGHFSNGQHQKKKNELPFLEANRKISDLSFIILKL
jgi:hypothetical protein